MKGALSVRELSLTYPRAAAPALSGVSLEVTPGERVLVTGPSGAGKSSLALCWSGIIPQSIPAQVTGAVELAGRPVAASRVADLSRDIAYVFQDADSQLCALTVEDEVAFALENRALPPAEIDRRVDQALSWVGLPAAMRRRDTRTLSGGEKQMVALAAALAQDTPLYVFDEPTSQLDPEATARTYAVIDRLARGDARRSLIYMDHKIEALLPLTDRVLVLGENGMPLAFEAPDTLFHDRAALVAGTGSWLPTAAHLYRFLRARGLQLAGRPLTVAAALTNLDRWLEQNPGMRPDMFAAIAAWIEQELAPPSLAVGKSILQLDRACYAPSGGPEIVSDVSLSLTGGEILGLVGRNGAGKSTLGLLLAGLLEPTRGARIGRDGSAAPSGQFVFQNPEHQFARESVIDELMLSLLASRDDGSPQEAARLEAEKLLRDFGLWHKRAAHPFQLSHGQKRRLSVLVAIAAPGRPIIVFDEPSYGLDADAAQRLRRTIAGMRRTDQAVVVISHDIDWLAGLCDRIAVLDRGRLARINSARAVLVDRQLLALTGLAPPQAVVIRAWLDARQ